MEIEWERVVRRLGSNWGGLGGSPTRSTLSDLYKQSCSPTARCVKFLETRFCVIFTK